MVCNPGKRAFYNDCGENYKGSAPAGGAILFQPGVASADFFPQVDAGQ
jgi:hypothetical protein